MMKFGSKEVLKEVLKKFSKTSLVIASNITLIINGGYFTEKARMYQENKR